VLGYHLHAYEGSRGNPPAEVVKQPMLQEFGKARLSPDGSDLKIFTGETGTGLAAVFLFVDGDGHIVNMLLAGNDNIEGPRYKIVKGNTHDWLVVSTIDLSGTGLIEWVDNWYLPGDSLGAPQSLFSYLSGGHNYPYPETGHHKEYKTEVENTK